MQVVWIRFIICERRSSIERHHQFLFQSVKISFLEFIYFKFWKLDYFQSLLRYQQHHGRFIWFISLLQYKFGDRLQLLLEAGGAEILLVDVFGLNRQVSLNILCSFFIYGYSYLLKLLDFLLIRSICVLWLGIYLGSWSYYTSFSVCSWTVLYSFTTSHMLILTFQTNFEGYHSILDEQWHKTSTKFIITDDNKEAIS